MYDKACRQRHPDDVMYAPIVLKGLRIDCRASVTPTWILNHVDTILGFVSGENTTKVLIDLTTIDKKLYQRPAEIFKLHKRAIVYTDQDIEVPTQ